MLIMRKYFAQTLLQLCLSFILQANGNKTDQWYRQINVVNESGGNIDIFWINSKTSEAHAMATSVKHGMDQPLNSFVGHTFEIRESPDLETGLCGAGHGDQFCRGGMFSVSEDDVDQQTFRVTSTFQVEYVVKEEEQKGPEELTYIRVPSRSSFTENMRPPEPRSRCRDQAKASLEKISLSPTIDPSTASIVIAEYTSCIEANMTHVLLDTNDVLSFQSVALSNAVDSFESYTCSDFNLPTSPAIRNETWSNKGKKYDVGILHERPRSKIHIISDFITEEECQAMEDAARPILHKAAVADGKGGSTISPNRKAMQAGIAVSWDKEEEGDPIASLSRRVYDYANYVTGLGFKENGQEDLMSIQYFGRGINDTEPDRYLPHCDGDCDGLPHKFGQRVATMVMYCTIPLKGGATNFRKAGIHIEPTKGFGAFFSYIGSDDLIMDEGFTEHSACPVVEGNKKVAVQWIRLGVDDDNTWDSFNTLGFKIGEDDEEA